MKVKEEREGQGEDPAGGLSPRRSSGNPRPAPSLYSLKYGTIKEREIERESETEVKRETEGLKDKERDRVKHCGQLQVYICSKKRERERKQIEIQRMNKKIKNIGLKIKSMNV